MASTKPVLLCVDDDETFLAFVSPALSEYEVRCARCLNEAIAALATPIDVALLDVRLRSDDPGNREGITLLRAIKDARPEAPVLMITGHGDIETAVECIKLGASDFIEKSRIDLLELKTRLQRAIEHGRLQRRFDEVTEELGLIEPRQIVGPSAALREIKAMIQALAQHRDATVLIRGETGTGKELVARAIHASGPRSGRPFVPVTISALSNQMMESELFGHERGAFTDAHARHIGYIEKAHTGVLFLDEIGEIDSNVQKKLLRFLEEREFQRLGSTTPISVDVQVIAATNADVEAAVRSGTFREDFYFRLRVFEVTLPPLRERIEDLEALISHFLALLRRRGKRIRGVSIDAFAAMKRCRWPGNIRQVKNALESAAFWAEFRGHVDIEIGDLPLDVVAGVQVRPTGLERKVGEPGFVLDEALARAELMYVDQALAAAHGKKSEAWQHLGYNDRETLYRRVRQVFEQFPSVIDEFPTIKTAFQRTIKQIRKER